MMQRRRLGCSNVEVSVVDLSTWQVLNMRGREEEARHEVVGAALDSRITLFDSFPVYGEVASLRVT